MEPDRTLPTAAGYVINFKMRLSYTVATDRTSYYSASAWSRPAGDYARTAENLPPSFGSDRQNLWLLQTASDKLACNVLQCGCGSWQTEPKGGIPAKSDFATMIGLIADALEWPEECAPNGALSCAP
jgi:hypothetical protein